MIKYLLVMMLAFVMTTAADARPRLKGALRDVNNHGLLNKALRDVGRNPTGWSHKWCGRQMAMWVGRGPNKASEWAKIGVKTHARPGAIAVMAHHVGVVKEVGKGYVVLVSGNHSGKSGRRTVGIGRYSMSRIIAFRAI